LWPLLHCASNHRSLPSSGRPNDPLDASPSRPQKDSFSFLASFSFPLYWLSPATIAPRALSPPAPQQTIAARPDLRSPTPPVPLPNAAIGSAASASPAVSASAPAGARAALTPCSEAARGPGSGSSLSRGSTRGPRCPEQIIHAQTDKNVSPTVCRRTNDCRVQALPRYGHVSTVPTALHTNLKVSSGQGTHLHLVQRVRECVRLAALCTGPGRLEAPQRAA
jgi:hypothetical protein